MPTEIHRSGAVVPVAPGGSSMFESIRQPKDLLAGLIFIIFGGLFLLDSFNYAFGTVRRMGPGWFPTVVACILIAIGAIIVLKSFFGAREDGPTFAWHPLIIVSLSLGVFTVLLRTAGVVPSVILLVLASAAAYRSQRPWVLVAGMAALCVVLGLPTWMLEAVGLGGTVGIVLAWISVGVILVGLALAFDPVPLFKMSLAAVGLGLFCGLVFVSLLGLPMPKFGPQLDQVIDPVLNTVRERTLDPVFGAIRSVLPGGGR